MECLSTIKQLVINKNKSIGQVVFLVEGESEEYKLLKHIFVDVLDYNYYALKNKKIIKDVYRSKNNSNSTVIVANTKNSNINSLFTDSDYKDKLYKILSEDFNSSLKNTRIYILWDRDVDSNEEDYVREGLNKFSNSFDNDNFDMNGILLLSYPCLEVYEISHFDKKLWQKKFMKSEDVKKLKKQMRYSLANIDEKTILLSIWNMHKSMLELGIYSYDVNNFKNINLTIFRKETELYKNSNMFLALSLISVVFVDLGIIEANK